MLVLCIPVVSKNLLAVWITLLWCCKGSPPRKLYETSEHYDLGNKVQYSFDDNGTTFEFSGDEPFSLESGAQMTYAKILATCGDYYSRPDIPISNGADEDERQRRFDAIWFDLNHDKAAAAQFALTNTNALMLQLYAFPDMLTKAMNYKDHFAGTAKVPGSMGNWEAYMAGHQRAIQYAATCKVGDGENIPFPDKRIQGSENWHRCSGCNGCHECGGHCCCDAFQIVKTAAPYCTSSLPERGIPGSDSLDSCSLTNGGFACGDYCCCHVGQSNAGGKCIGTPELPPRGIAASINWFTCSICNGCSRCDLLKPDGVFTSVFTSAVIQVFQGASKHCCCPVGTEPTDKAPWCLEPMPPNGIPGSHKWGASTDCGGCHTCGSYSCCPGGMKVISGPPFCISGSPLPPNGIPGSNAWGASTDCGGCHTCGDHSCCPAGKKVVSGPPYCQADKPSNGIVGSDKWKVCTGCNGCSSCAGGDYCCCPAGKSPKASAPYCSTPMPAGNNGIAGSDAWATCSGCNGCYASGDFCVCPPSHDVTSASGGYCRPKARSRRLSSVLSVSQEAEAAAGHGEQQPQLQEEEQKQKQKQQRRLERTAAHTCLRRALMMEACAAHFLSDQFASGHMRTPMAEIIDPFRQGGWNAIGAKTIVGKNIVNYNHGIDNKQGLVVVNRKGERWRAYGDQCLGTVPLAVGNKRLPFYHNDENRRRQVQVLVASVGEVVEAYATQQGSAGAGVADTSASEVYMSVPDTARVQDLDWSSAVGNLPPFVYAQQAEATAAAPDLLHTPDLYFQNSPRNSFAEVSELSFTKVSAGDSGMMEGFAAMVMLTKWEGASICTYRDEVGAAAASVLASSGRSRLQSPSAPKQSEHFLYRLVETSQGFMYCSGPAAAVRLERGTKGVHDCFNRCSALGPEDCSHFLFFGGNGQPSPREGDCELISKQKCTHGFAEFKDVPPDQTDNPTHPHCDEAAFIAFDRGASYRGCQDTTQTGKPCRKWEISTAAGAGAAAAAGAARRFARNSSSYPDAGLEGGHSYCRNPDGAAGIWCYTAATAIPANGSGDGGGSDSGGGDGGGLGWEFCDAKAQFKGLTYEMGAWGGQALDASAGTLANLVPAAGVSAHTTQTEQKAVRDEGEADLPLKHTPAMMAALQNSPWMQKLIETTEREAASGASAAASALFLPPTTTNKQRRGAATCVFPREASFIADDAECAFPFVYEGVAYASCTQIAWNMPWCATEVDANGTYISGQWGVCKKFCGAPVPASPPPTELVSVELALAPQLPPGALEFVHSPWRSAFQETIANFLMLPSSAVEVVAAAGGGSGEGSGGSSVVSVAISVTADLVPDVTEQLKRLLLKQVRDDLTAKFSALYSVLVKKATLHTGSGSNPGFGSSSAGFTMSDVAAIEIENTNILETRAIASKVDELEPIATIPANTPAPAVTSTETVAIIALGVVAAIGWGLVSSFAYTKRMSAKRNHPPAIKQHEVESTLSS